MSQLVTGEAVALDLRTAGAASRVLAALIDLSVQAVLYGGVMLLVVLSSNSSATLAALSISALVLVGLGYPVLLETLLTGRTLGKLIMGLRVVRDDGGPIGFRQAFVRGLLGLFVEKPGITGGSGALMSSLLNAQGKRLGDLAAGTIVVQERVARTSLDLVYMPPELAAWAASADLSALSDELVMAVRTFLGRYPGLTATTQSTLGEQLVGQVSRAVGPVPPGTSPGAFLSAVVAERRRRAQAVVASTREAHPVTPTAPQTPTSAPDPQRPPAAKQAIPTPQPNPDPPTAAPASGFAPPS